jgi:hypothetical protein
MPANFLQLAKKQNAIARQVLQLDREARAGALLANPQPVPPGYRRPDLVIAQFELTDPAHGLVTVEVTNKGGGPAGPSTFRLIVWEQGKFEQQEAKTVFVKVRSMKPGAASSSR